MAAWWFKMSMAGSFDLMEASATARPMKPVPPVMTIEAPAREGSGRGLLKWRVRALAPARPAR
jgi:hypothetical protein